MHYKPKSTAGLQIALGGLPDKMRVRVDPDVPLSAKTVRELREVTTFTGAPASSGSPRDTMVVVRVSHYAIPGDVSALNLATGSGPFRPDRLTHLQE